MELRALYAEERPKKSKAAVNSDHIEEEVSREHHSCNVQELDNETRDSKEPSVEGPLAVYSAKSDS